MPTDHYPSTPEPQSESESETDLTPLENLDDSLFEGTHSVNTSIQSDKTAMAEKQDIPV